MSKTRIYKIYLRLLKKYGLANKCWKKWCKIKKTKKDKEEILIGAILTQRTNWKNVELAFKNLRKAKVLSIKKIYQVGKRNPKLLENLIRPAGFYHQKAKRLFLLCKFIVENYGSLEKFFEKDLKTCRKGLLTLYGIGPETADSILLYAGEKPIFVIDEYTRRFVRKHNLAKKFSYDFLQNLFQKNLTKDTKIYQNFHALIVLDGKNEPR
jgi:endonuclease-3 related protein